MYPAGNLCGEDRSIIALAATVGVWCGHGRCPWSARLPRELGDPHELTTMRLLARHARGRCPATMLTAPPALTLRGGMSTQRVDTRAGAMTEADQKQIVAQPRKVGVREFRGNLTGFLRQVRQGQSFLVTSYDEVLAEVRPPPPSERPRRRPGALRGRIRMAPDFDELPPDILAAMEGEHG